MAYSPHPEKAYMDEFYRRRSDQLEKDISELLDGKPTPAKPNSMDPAILDVYSPLDSIKAMSRGFGGIVRRSSSLYSDVSSIDSVGIKTPRRASDGYSPQTPTGFVSAEMYFVLNDLSDGADDAPQKFGTFADFPNHNDLMPVPLFLPSPTDHQASQNAGHSHAGQEEQQQQEEEDDFRQLPGALRLRRGGAITHHEHDDRRQSTGALGLRGGPFVSSRESAAWQLRAPPASNRHSYQPATSKPSSVHLEEPFSLKRQWSWETGDEGQN